MFFSVLGLFLPGSWSKKEASTAPVFCWAFSPGALDPAPSFFSISCVFVFLTLSASERLAPKSVVIVPSVLPQTRRHPGLRPPKRLSEAHFLRPELLLSGYFLFFLFFRCVSKGTPNVAPIARNTEENTVFGGRVSGSPFGEHLFSFSLSFLFLFLFRPLPAPKRSNTNRNPGRATPVHPPSTVSAKVESLHVNFVQA